MSQLKHNPADVGSRGSLSSKIRDIWWKGPSYIVCRRFEPPPLLLTTSPSMTNPPFFIFFPNPPLLARLFRQYHSIEIPDKHKNKLMWQSYFFIFKETKKQRYMLFFYKMQATPG